MTDKPRRGREARASPEAAAAEPEPVPPADPLAEFFFQAEEQPAAGAAVPAAKGPAGPSREYLGFKLGDEHYAVELLQVREIVKPPPLTEVPRAPAEIAGVMTLRGEVIPVFDLKRRLGLPASEPGRHARVVVVETGEGPAGVAVDSVEQVVRLPEEHIEPPPPGLGVETECLAGIGRQDERLYVLLQLSAVFERAGGPR